MPSELAPSPRSLVSLIIFLILPLLQKPLQLSFHIFAVGVPVSASIAFRRWLYLEAFFLLLAGFKLTNVGSHLRILSDSLGDFCIKGEGLRTQVSRIEREVEKRFDAFDQCERRLRIWRSRNVMRHVGPKTCRR